MGSTLDLARRDAARFINNGGFEVTITFKEDSGEVYVKGLATKHHNSIDTDGLPIIGKNTHITINESDLVVKGITVRNSEGEVAIKDKLVSWADSSGVSKDYIIDQVMPNETLGHIVCILGDVE